MTSAATRPSTPVRLRAMRPVDVDVLLLYESELFGSEAWSRHGYLEELADTELRYYLVAEEVAEEVAKSITGDVAEDAGEATAGSGLLGSAGLMTVAETAQILTVGVLPAARRRGIGGLLVRALVAEAVRRRAEEVLLEVRMDNAAARQLYLDEGFQVIGTRRGYYDHGRIDAVVMRREL